VPAVQTAYDAAPVFTYQNFKPSKNVKEAVARMTGTVAERVDLPSGAKIRMINETHSAMIEVQERFGLGPSAFIGSPKKSGVRYRWPDGAVAAYDMRRDYYLGGDKAFDYDRIDAGIEVSRGTAAMHYEKASRGVAAGRSERGIPLSDDVRSRFSQMPPEKYKWSVANGPKDIAMHELGHRLHGLNRSMFDGIMPSNSHAGEWGVLISRYAQTNNEELVAESFALYMQGDRSQFFRIYPPLLKIFETMDKVKP
jgi:hypothetical protein